MWIDRFNFCSKIILNSNICVMIGGRVAMGKKPLTSRCRPDEVKTSFDCCTLFDHFHFSSCSFLYLCVHVYSSVLDKDSLELKVLANKINSEVKKAFGCSRDESSSSS